MGTDGDPVTMFVGNRSLEVLAGGCVVVVGAVVVVVVVPPATVVVVVVVVVAVVVGCAWPIVYENRLLSN